MHYLGLVTEQLTHVDPRIEQARREAHLRHPSHRIRVRVRVPRTWHLPHPHRPTALARRSPSVAAGS